VIDALSAQLQGLRDRVQTAFERRLPEEKNISTADLEARREELDRLSAELKRSSEDVRRLLQDAPLSIDRHARKGS